MDPAARGTNAHRVGVVTGLASEAAVISAILADTALEAEVVCAGASSQRAAELSRQLVAEGSEALLSFGVAGGLAPDLDCGDLIVAHGVQGTDGDDLATDSAWRSALTGLLDEMAVSYREAAILGSDRPLRGAADKAAAFADSGCLAVDMESAALAGVAAKAGLPFLAVRAIADRAGDALPALVDTAIKPDGRPAVGRVLAALVRRPSDIPATLRLGRQTELALARLRMLEAAKAPLLGRF